MGKKLFGIISKNDIKQLGTILEQGVDNINIQDQYGNTPLHYAASDNRPEMVDLLIEHGASLDSQNGSKHTPLFKAVQNNANEAALLLISLGANTDIEDVNGKKIAQIARDMDNITVLMNLLIAGADVRFTKLQDFLYRPTQYYQELKDNFDQELISPTQDAPQVRRVDLFKFFLHQFFTDQQPNKDLMDYVNLNNYDYKEDLKKIFVVLSQAELQELIQGYKAGKKNKPIVDILVKEGFIRSPDELDFKKTLQKTPLFGTGDMGFKFN